MVPNHKLILGRKFLFWGPYADNHALRFKLRSHLHSERTLQWVKEAAKIYRALHFAVVRRRLNRGTRL
jgi:hypothetical protein